MRRVGIVGFACLLLGGCYAVHEGDPPDRSGDRGTAERLSCGVAGQACDAVPGDGERTCYYPEGDRGREEPIAEVMYRFEITDVGGSMRVLLILSEDFVDNSYGEGSSAGYRDRDRGHRFRDLVRSDHAAFALSDGVGREVVDVRIDYLSEAADAPSGYRSLGVWGGDGRVDYRDSAHVLFATSSLDDNLNLRGCVSTDSSPSASECPEWEPRVIYALWVAQEAFGPAGFGAPSLDHIHASPSRLDSTIDVVAGPCP